MSNALFDNQAGKLNFFTHAMSEQCLAKGQVTARLRNGEWRDVKYMRGSDSDNATSSGSFRSADNELAWLADGNSTVNARFDIVEFKPAAEVLETWTALFLEAFVPKSCPAEPMELAELAY